MAPAPFTPGFAESLALGGWVRLFPARTGALSDGTRFPMASTTSGSGRSKTTKRTSADEAPAVDGDGVQQDGASLTDPTTPLDDTALAAAEVAPLSAEDRAPTAPDEDGAAATGVPARDLEAVVEAAPNGTGEEAITAPVTGDADALAAEAVETADSPAPVPSEPALAEPVAEAAPVADAMAEPADATTGVPAVRTPVRVRTARVVRPKRPMRLTAGAAGAATQTDGATAPNGEATAGSVDEALAAARPTLPDEPAVSVADVAPSKDLAERDDLAAAAPAAVEPVAEPAPEAPFDRAAPAERDTAFGRAETTAAPERGDRRDQRRERDLPRAAADDQRRAFEPRRGDDREGRPTRDDRPDRPTADDRQVTERAAALAAAPVDDEATPTFEDLGLSGALLRSIRDVGYEEPTPIQLGTIPVLLEGVDVIAQAQTGSGKTAAYGLPIIESIDPRDRTVQALILCPTRELAIQVSEALHKYGRHKEVETLPIYGGQPYERQFRGLQRGVQIVVGTPGRVMDHMRRGTLNLASTRFFVLDEADEMLDMGFIDDIEWILEQVPTERQTALFSATMPPRIVELARHHMRDPRRVTVASKQMTVAETRQTAYEVPRSRKTDALTRILDAEEPTSTMIFCRTKHAVDELGEALLARGYAVETLHGDLSQPQRDRVMRRFRGAQADVLIATDVAARGLDIPDVSHVINFDIPESAEAYVHRVGRTGRAGRRGDAITLITPKETRWLRQIERIVRAKIEIRRLPTLADVAERRREAMKGQIEEALKDATGVSPYRQVIEDLADERDVLEVAAAVLKLYADETGRSAPENVQEDDLATFSVADRGRGETGMTRLFLNVGRQQMVRPQDIVGAIANEARIPGRAIGAIDILDAYTFVDVPTEFVERVITALGNAKIKGRPVHAEVAQAGAGQPEGPPARDFQPRGDGGRDGGFRGGDGGARGGPGGFRGDRGGFRGGDGGFRGDRGGGGFRGPRDAGSGPPRREDDRFDRGGPPRFDRSGPPRFDRDRGPSGPPRDDRGGYSSFRRDDGPRRSFGGPRREGGSGGGGRSFDRNDRPARPPVRDGGVPSQD